jgi:hypothetical protein
MGRAKPPITIPTSRATPPLKLPRLMVGQTKSRSSATTPLATPRYLPQHQPRGRSLKLAEHYKAMEHAAIRTLANPLCAPSVSDAAEKNLAIVRRHLAVLTDASSAPLFVSISPQHQRRPGSQKILRTLEATRPPITVAPDSDRTTHMAEEELTNARRHLSLLLDASYEMNSCTRFGQ